MVRLTAVSSDWLAARGWVVRSGMPPTLASTYRWFRALNLVLLLVGLAGLTLTWPEDPTQAWFLLVVWGFGVIEYVNYFVVRLSYPPSVWFSRVGQRRTPRLMQDVDAARPPVQ